MQPLSASNVDDLDYQSRIWASGTVSSVDTTTISFTMHATQYVTGGQSSDDIVIRALLDGNPKWVKPSDRLPQVNGIVSFSGAAKV